MIEIINADAKECSGTFDMIFTDPPYEMPGSELACILDGFDSGNLVMLTTMKQLIELINSSDWELAFDFVVDGVMPKKSKSVRQPNYLHQTGVYMTKPGAKSLFNRKLRQRSDVFEANGYWPTIIRAPRSTSTHALGKNQEAMTDLLGSFHVSSVVDPFAGGGTTGVSAFELGIDCTMIEINHVHAEKIKKTFNFLR